MLLLVEVGSPGTVMGCGGWAGLGSSVPYVLQGPALNNQRLLGTHRAPCFGMVSTGNTVRDGGVPWRRPHSLRREGQCDIRASHPLLRVLGP